MKLGPKTFLSIISIVPQRVYDIYFENEERGRKYALKSLSCNISNATSQRFSLIALHSQGFLSKHTLKKGKYELKTEKRFTLCYFDHYSCFTQSTCRQSKLNL